MESNNKVKVGIAIDSWKLKIFKKHLTDAGYEFEKGKGLTGDMLFLYVKVEVLGVPALQKIVQNAIAESRRTKMN